MCQNHPYVGLEAAIIKRNRNRSRVKYKSAKNVLGIKELPKLQTFLSGSRTFCKIDEEVLKKILEKSEVTMLI